MTEERTLCIPFRRLSQVPRDLQIQDGRHPGQGTSSGLVLGVTVGGHAVSSSPVSQAVRTFRFFSVENNVLYVCAMEKTWRADLGERLGSTQHGVIKQGWEFR